jgi:hypothetical protein
MATEAVMAAQMATQTSKLVRREEVAEGTMAFHFEKPSGFKFEAGQVRRCDTHRAAGN